MTPLRYFYSTDGTDSHGPVDEAELRLLLQSERIGPQSFLCREGENTWEPLDPEAFRSVDVGALPNALPVDSDLSVEKRGIPVILVMIGAAVVLLVVIFAATPGPQPAQPGAGIAASKHSDTSEDLKIPVTAKYDGRTPIILRGQLKKIQNGTFGDSSFTARFVRALLSICGELPDKIEAARAKEDGCKFAVQSDANSAVLASQISDLEDLRDVQTDVVDYLQNFDPHFCDDLAGNSIPTYIQPRLDDIVHRRLNIDQHLALWQAKLNLTNDDIARLKFLQMNAGHWTINDRKITFTDASLRANHEHLLDAIRDDLKKISKFQDDLLQRQHDVVT